jgi:Protein of unknown function (DUF3261)
VSALASPALGPALLLGLVLGLPACSLLTPKPATAPPPQPERGILRLPAPPGYPGQVAAVQSIHAVRGDQIIDVQALLEVSAAHLVLVLAQPLGPRLATIDWSADGVAIERAPGPTAAAALQPEDVLADLMLAFWPEAAVRSSLRAGLSLVVAPDRRLVMKDDALLIEVRRDDADPWNGTVRLDNQALGYQLTIVSQAVP